MLTTCPVLHLTAGRPGFELANPVLPGKMVYACVYINFNNLFDLCTALTLICVCVILEQWG